MVRIPSSPAIATPVNALALHLGPKSVAGSAVFTTVMSTGTGLFAVGCASTDRIPIAHRKVPARTTIDANGVMTHNTLK
jgi:hypothetical protein